MDEGEFNVIVNVAVEFIVGVATKAIVIDVDRPVEPFAADEAAVCSLTAAAGSSEEASRAFEALGCPLLDPCWGETSGRSLC